jgi:RHH-type proline utilization regulon transcriptional repressor/proline dehydrogenase/delta 1-pyrroline-5-carboxylate dehydrogenase
MDCAMKDPGFKVQFLRFIDVFPSLSGSKQVYRHLMEYLSQDGVTLPAGLNAALSAGGWLKGTLSRTISSQIESMAHSFIAGEDAASALPELRKLWERGVAFSVDLLGEACVSGVEARAYQQRYLDLIETLPRYVNEWPAAEARVAGWKPAPQDSERGAGLDGDYLGPIPRTNISIKISSLYARTSPVASPRSEISSASPLAQAVPGRPSPRAKDIVLMIETYSSASSAGTCQTPSR